MKRLAALLIMLSILISLAACGGNAPTVTNSTSANSENTSSYTTSTPGSSLKTSNDSSVKEGNSYGNWANGGHTAMIGDYVLSGYDRILADGSAIRRIFNKACNINISGDKIYYTLDTHDCLSIYRSDLNGDMDNSNNREKVYTGEGIARVWLYDGWLYFTHGEDYWAMTLSKVKTDGTGLVDILIGECQSDGVTITTDMIYYLKDSQIYAVGPDGSNPRLITDAKIYSDYSSPILNGDRLYFIDKSDYAVRSIKTNGSDPQTLIETETDSMNIDGGVLYFTSKGNTGGKLYSLPLSGGTPKLLYQERHCSGIHAAGDRLVVSANMAVLLIKKDGSDPQLIM